jgi:hypothetical protein
MSRFVRNSGLAALVLLCVSASAHGFGWRLFPFRSHYYAPVAYYPAYFVPTCQSAPIPVNPYAAPRSAPASQSGEPPVDASKPKVTESRTHGAKFASAKDDRIRVGFWNITGRDVTILVDGQSRALARNQSITLDLGRSFNWQFEGRQQAEQIPQGQTTFEVVLRPAGAPR